VRFKKGIVMNDQHYTLENIRNQAKKKKKELGITHTQALELVAKELGYSNWIHCNRSLIQQPSLKVNPVNETILVEFNDWLRRQKNRNSPLGDLSQEMLKDNNWPSYNSLEGYKKYFTTINLPRGATSALEAAWKSYHRYLLNQTSPRTMTMKQQKTESQANKYPEIVRIKNVTPIHFTKRTVEKFNPGDSAWISWDGIKAMPVTITEVDDRYYTFKVWRPLKKAGDEHYLRLDEVRSTPELACMNHVTL
jgi:hypothetical protein